MVGKIGQFGFLILGWLCFILSIWKDEFILAGLSCFTVSMIFKVLREKDGK